MTPLAYLSIAWAIGTWLGSRLALHLHIWIGTALAAFLATFLARPSKARLFLTCVAALALGATRLILAEPRMDEHSLANYNDQGKRTLVGMVADEPDVRDSFVFYKLDAENLLLPDSGEALTVKGAARVRGPRYPVYNYGDRLQIHGNLETPPVLEGFDYRDYLAHKGIQSQVPYAQIERLSGGEGSPWKRLMLSFKGRAQATIGRILPEPEASLLTGVLLGNEGGISSELKEDFKATGASHVIAISGFNISIICALMMATIGRVVVDRRLAAGIAMLGVAVYTLLVGADAAVVRAAAMGAVTLLGLMANRTGVALNTLAIAALAMMAFDPHMLKDVGFQLSVAATLGLILYAKPFESVTYRLLTPRFSSERAKQIVGWISEALLLTLAAQILTTPLILWHFGRLSVVSLLTNVLILPIQSLVMVFGGAALVVGLALEPLGRVVGWGAYPWLNWTIRVVEWTARFPYASVPLELSDLGLLALYALIGLLSILALLDLEPRRALWQTLRARLSLTATMGGMALVTTVAWFAVLQFPDDKLHVTFLDVGQGDAIFIETPGGAQILVDGGPDGSAVLSELGRQMPFWDRTLDLVVLTHPDADHLTGLIAVLERYGVRAVVAGHAPHKTDLLQTWETALATGGALPIQGQAGTRLELSDDITLDILHPVPNSSTANEDEINASTTNDNSVVMRLVYRNVAFLLPGDVEAEVEQRLVRSGAYLRSTVIKVPHHGSKTSSSQAFLAAAQPQVAVISVGADNDFGHPSRDVLQRLQDTPHVYRTDRDGCVTISSDGHKLWIETEH
jgi:competence protein ComEC